MKPIFRSGEQGLGTRVKSARIFAAMLRSKSNAHGQRLLDWAFGGYAWALLVIVVLIFGGLIALLQRPTWGRVIARAATRMLFRLVGIPVSVEGIESLPSSPHLLLVNHTSFLDGLVLTALLPARPGYAFAVKQQYRSQALLWPLLRGLGTVLLSHSEPGYRGENINKLASALDRGHRLVVFPEGGITPDAGLKQFHSGTFIAAARANVPVVVAGMNGARSALRLGTWLPRRAPIHFQIGPIFMPMGKDPMAVMQLIRSTRRAMGPLTGEEDGRLTNYR